MGAGDTPGDTAQGAIQLTGVLEASFGDGDHVGSTAPLPHQPRARAQPRTPPGGHTAGLGEGLGQCPKAALGGLAQATVGVFLQLVGDAPDQQIAAEPPGRGCLVKTPPFITQRGQLYRPKRRDPLLQGGHLIGPAWGHAGLGFRGHMFGPEPSAEGTHSDARLPAQVQSKAVVLATGVSSVRHELAAAAGGTCALLYVAAVPLYYAERDVQPDAFGSIPAALWWSVVTLTTVGYGDVIPVTPVGRVLTGVIVLLGIGVVAVPTGLIASGLAATK